VSYAYDLKNIKMVPIETNKYKEDLAKRFK